MLLENVHTGRREDISDADTVVLSVGMRSNRELYDALKEKAKSGKGFTKELYFVGDAVAPRLIQQVIYEAEQLARRI